MTTEAVIEIGREALLVTVSLAGPLLVTGLLIGVMVSLMQAVTQVQEMTLTFIPKIIGMVVALAIFMPWMLRAITGFTARILANLASYGRYGA